MHTCFLNRFAATPLRHNLARYRLFTRAPRLAAHADVAQLVAHHLAKVRVAGSNPVVRSALIRATGPPQRPPSDPLD